MSLDLEESVFIDKVELLDGLHGTIQLYSGNQMTQSILSIGANSVIRLSGLKDYNDVYQNDATVTLEELVERITDTPVSGVTTPMSLLYVPSSNGVYEGALPYNIGIEARKVYRATIRAISSGGLRKDWVETIKVKVAEA